MLVAVTLLNKTAGTHALPVFWHLMDKWPSASALARGPCLFLLPSPLPVIHARNETKRMPPRTVCCSRAFGQQLTSPRSSTRSGRWASKRRAARASSRCPARTSSARLPPPLQNPRGRLYGPSTTLSTHPSAPASPRRSSLHPPPRGSSGGARGALSRPYRGSPAVDSTRKTRTGSSAPGRTSGSASCRRTRSLCDSS